MAAAIEEVVRLAETTGVRFQISHLAANVSADQLKGKKGKGKKGNFNLTHTDIGVILSYQRHGDRALTKNYTESLQKSLF